MRAVLAAHDIAGPYQLLKEAGLSQRDIARLTGQSQSEVSEILARRRCADGCPDHGSPGGAATAPTGTTAPWSAHCAGRSAPAAPHPRATPTTHHRQSLTTTA
jgi:hypothetical protein